MDELMRGNPVPARLARGEPVYGVMVFEFFTPGLMAALAAAGAEFVVLDMEHSGVGIETIKAQLACARGLPIAPIVRVPAGHYHLMAPILDAGAMGIMVPMVESAMQAAAIASCCRYRPAGRRGLAFGIAHDDYRGGDVGAKMRAANARTLVIPLIETSEGIANAEQIMAVEGIDVGWLGHFDLTNTLGITADFAHPRFIAAVDTLLGACRAHRKAAGYLAGSVAEAEVFRARGFRCLAYGTDLSHLQTGLRDGLDRLRASSG